MFACVRSYTDNLEEDHGAAHVGAEAQPEQAREYQLP